MAYLEAQMPIKENPRSFWPQAQTALVFTQDYGSKDDFPSAKEASKSKLRTAMYAKGPDYHFWFKDKLKLISDELKLIFPNAVFLPFIDSGPLLERDLAARAGLGWVGKNTCLINRKKGSLFFIGEILTSAPVAQDDANLNSARNDAYSLTSDFCGTCRKCIEACPTGALTKERELLPKKCISYWTIESKTTPPLDLREKLNDWFFGCDICQTVCPWNQKAYNNSLEMTQLRDLNLENRQLLIEDLRFILSSSGKKLEKYFAGTPLVRARPFGLKRNAIIVATNQNLIELKPEISVYLENNKLSELAKWSLSKLG
jgi:epoxyqueuosine reductase